MKAKRGGGRRSRPLAGGLAALLAVPAAAAVAAPSAAPGWSAAADRLAAPVYRPAALPRGMRLARLTTERLRCGDRTVEQVVATYRRADRFLVRILEGTPFFCADLGDVRRLAGTRIGRSRAAIYESPNSDNRGGIILTWNTDWRSTGSSDSVGTAMYVEIGSKDQALAIRIGRGMRLVPR